MDATFDSDAYIARIGERLVSQFNDARTATSPSTVGAAMEQPVRKQLEQILPRGVAAGSGFVIDSEGNTSRQSDVVLYERDICPVFSINETPETTYYPCEGVVAVGEVKSVLDRSSLEDAFEKIASVKRLRRFSVREFMPHPTKGSPIVKYRKYGELSNTSGIIDVKEEHEFRAESQMFGFVVAGRCTLSEETLCNVFLEVSSQYGDASPNMIAILDDSALLNWGRFTDRQWEKEWNEESSTYGMRERRDGKIRWESLLSARDADSFRYSPDADPFRALVRWVYEAFRSGTTSDVRAFDEYLKMRVNGSQTDESRFVPKSGVPLEDHLRQFRRSG